MFDNYTVRGGVVVVPSDTVDVLPAEEPEFLYVGGSGDVTVTLESGEVLDFVGVPSGSDMRMRFTRVHATGTTATKMLALY